MITSLRLNLTEISPEEDELIHTLLMRPQQAAMRTAYNRLLEGMGKKDIYHLLRKRFPTLSGWGCNGAISLAEGTLASRKALLKNQITYLEGKIERLQRKAKRYPQIQQKIDPLEEKLTKLLTHRGESTVPPALFGGRKLWRQVQRSVPGAREAWRFVRTNTYFLKGESANKYGNREFRFSFSELTGKAVLAIRIPTSPVQWLRVPGEYSRKQHALFAQIAAGEKFTVRLVRLAPGQYRAWLTIDEPVVGEYLEERVDVPRTLRRIAGVDLNLDHAALAWTDAEGQYRGSQVFRYAGIGELPRAKSRPKLGSIAKEIVEMAKSQGAQALVLEDLSLAQEKRATRRTASFIYRQLHNLLVRRAQREGLQVKLVHPAYTSWIGQLKYSRMYGISGHQAAAYVIARRGLGFDEHIPRFLVQQFPLIEEKVSPRHGEMLKAWKEHSPTAGKPW